MEGSNGRSIAWVFSSESRDVMAWTAVVRTLDDVVSEECLAVISGKMLSISNQCKKMHKKHNTITHHPTKS